MSARKYSPVEKGYSRGRLHHDPRFSVRRVSDIMKVFMPPASVILDRRDVCVARLRVGIHVVFIPDIPSLHVQLTLTARLI